MSRLGAALAVLLLAAPLAALLPQAAAQFPGGGFVIPTQQDALVGGLNLTAWVMRDTRTITATPDLRSNPLGYLWNLNFTAGSLGILYLRATVVENGTYAMDVALNSPSGAVMVVPPLPNQTSFAACANEANRARCTVGGNRSTADATLQFFIPSSAPPGPTRMEVAVTVANNATPPQELGRHTFTYQLAVLDPLPAHAVRAQVGSDVTLGAWTNGGVYGSSSGGCLAGSNALRDENVSNGAPAVICLVAVTTSQAMLRVRANLTGASWFTATEEGWLSEPFNVTSGGIVAPVHGFPFFTNGQAPLGAGKATLSYAVERQNGEAWEPAGSGTMDIPFTVTNVVLIPGRGPAGLNWLAHAPLLVASVAGLGYLAYTNRQPKFEARSQSLRDQQLRRKTKDDEAGTAAIAQQQREDVQEQSFEKKRVILDAKRDDILKSIKIAEERSQRGEITEHVLKGIRERKERQLEQVQKEMEELGQ